LSEKAQVKTKTKTDRSAIMRAVKSTGTGPELQVRKLAHAIRPGYRLHRSDVAGKPDLAYIGESKAIFVHGCFWHGHDCARGARIPKQNRDYWVAKVARNVARDSVNLSKLNVSGWRTLVIWECELKDEAGVSERLKIFLAGASSKP
jgi:DNA mismatch endonuclease (patch repair protein)